MNLNDPIILMGGAGLLVLLFIVVLSSLLGEGAKNRRKMRERMKTLGDRGKKSKTAAAEGAGSLRREEGKTALDKLARRILPNPEIMRARLEATGKPITIGTYFGMCLVVGLLVGVAAFMSGFVPPLALPFVAIGGGLLLPHKYVSMQIAKRQEAFVAQLAQGLDLIVRGVKSGLPVGETISSVSTEMEDPIASEMRRVIEDTRIGNTLEAALWQAALRVNVAEFKFFVVTLTVQRETGGNLAETLENLAELVRTRKHMKLKVRAMASEAYASRNILGGLPVAIGSVLAFIAPQYIGILFTTDPGNWLLGIGLTLLGMGWLVMTKMVNFEI